MKSIRRRIVRLQWRLDQAEDISEWNQLQAELHALAATAVPGPPTRSSTESTRR